VVSWLFYACWPGHVCAVEAPAHSGAVAAWAASLRVQYAEESVPTDVLSGRAGPIVPARRRLPLRAQRV